MTDTQKYQRVTCWNCDGKGLIASYDRDGFVSPDECSTCGGSGTVVRYKSGVLAKYPGGPLLGREPKP